MLLHITHPYHTHMHAPRFSPPGPSSRSGARASSRSARPIWRGRLHTGRAPTGRQIGHGLLLNPPPHLLPPRAAGGGGGGGGAGADADDDAPFDIDDLARRLSAEAEIRRRAEASAASTSSSPASTPSTPPPPPSSDGPFGVGAAARVAEVLAELGDGGFVPEDIELVQELGRVSWQVGDSGGDGEGGSGGSAPTTAAVVYAARYTPALHFQTPTPVLVKEYLPHAATLAANELQVGARLAGGRLPARPWHAAMAGRGVGASPAAPPPPTAPLLGFFRAAPADPAAAAASIGWLTAGPRGTGSTDPASSLWLVFRWEAVQPLSFYPASRQAPDPPRPFAALTRMLSGGASAANALPPSTPPPIDLSSPSLARRCAMLRAIAGGTLRALASVHAAGIAHGSLGGGGVLLSSYDDARAGTLRVCLDNFGFAQVRRRGGVAVGEDGGEGGSSLDDGGGAAPPRSYPPPLLSFGPGSPGFVPPPASSALADDPVSAAQAADAVAAGRLLLETVLAALPLEGPPVGSASASFSSSDSDGDDDGGVASSRGSPPPGVRSLGAALVSSHAGDAAGLAASVRADPAWAVADALLSSGEGAGYALLARLAAGDARFGEILRENWFVNGGRGRR